MTVCIEKSQGDGRLVTVKKPSPPRSTANLYTLEHERVSRFLRGKGYGGEAVEDVVRETFSRLTATSKLDVMQDPEHYLFTMAYGALRAQEDAQFRSELEGAVDGPRLLVALKTLPESLLTPLLLSFRGMTEGEIAGYLGLSVDATRDRLLRAQARLVRCIEQANA